LNLIEAIVLGVIQGLTEFLPISSTGHLTLAGKLMGVISDKNPESWTAFMAVIQLGTMAAVLIYFWKDLYRIFIGFIKDNLIKPKSFSNQSLDLNCWFIILGAFPLLLLFRV